MPLRGLSTLRISDYKKKIEWLTCCFCFLDKTNKLVWFPPFGSTVRVRPGGGRSLQTLHSRSVAFSCEGKKTDCGYTING